MNFLKRIWRKLLGVKTGEYDSGDIFERTEWARQNSATLRHVRPAYDPSEDELKKMNGEVESYFD